MHAIVHVEIPVTNMKRAKEWYGKIFGWTFQDFGKDFALWSPVGGGVGGGFNLLKKIPAKGSVRAYIEVEDVGAKLDEIKKARGKITVPKTEVPTYGWWGAFQDPQGAELYLWQRVPGR